MLTGCARDSRLRQPQEKALSSSSRERDDASQKQRGPAQLHSITVTEKISDVRGVERIAVAAYIFFVHDPPWHSVVSTSHLAVCKSMSWFFTYHEEVFSTGHRIFRFSTYSKKHTVRVYRLGRPRRGHECEHVIILLNFASFPIIFRHHVQDVYSKDPSSLSYISCAFFRQLFTICFLKLF